MADQKKIVVIDDEEDILYTIKEICEFSGYSVVTRSNGIDGYNTCKEEKPNLVIVDYHMPGWDGLTTVKKIKEIDPSVSILVLTVDERQEIADRFMDAGATDFAIKPIKAPDLIARINVNLKINEIQMKYIKDIENVYIDKGISPATLSVIKDYFEAQSNSVTIEEITEGVNLAYQTVHRYVKYLVEKEVLDIIPVYGQKGRPKNKYVMMK